MSSDAVPDVPVSSPESVREGMGLVRTGKVYRLGVGLSDQMIQLDDNPNRSRGRRYRLLPAARRPGSGSLTEVLEIPGHTGTHIDALGHWISNETVYSGVSVEEAWGPSGLTKNSVAECPAIVARGVLFDVAGVLGYPMLESDARVTVENLVAALGESGVRAPGVGEVALIRTGWIDLFYKADPRYICEEPGLTIEAAEWLADRGVVAIGADNWAIEAISPLAPTSRVVHETCLAKRGIFLIENLDLQSLSTDRMYEFCFAALPIRIEGATCSPLEPVAIV